MATAKLEGALKQLRDGSTTVIEYVPPTTTLPSLSKYSHLTSLLLLAPNYHNPTASTTMAWVLPEQPASETR